MADVRKVKNSSILGKRTINCDHDILEGFTFKIIIMDCFFSSAKTN